MRRAHVSHIRIGLLAAAVVLAEMDGLQAQRMLEPTEVDLAKAGEFAIEAIEAVVASVQEPREALLASDPRLRQGFIGTSPASTLCTDGRLGRVAR